MVLNEKNELRNYIWDVIKEEDISNRPDGDHGKIPDFKGSHKAAKLLAMTIEWDESHNIFCSPDSAQRIVREFALRDGKNLIIPSPKLEKGYLFITPKNAQSDIKTASTIEGTFKFGNPIEKFPKIDIVVEGSVAVDKEGNRLGKGGGYGDKEIKELFRQGSINQKTPIITTVHPVQIIDNIPTEKHDEKINMIITPDFILRLFLDPSIPVVR
ncbi:5-formyltetrahydrofolate cyclo-ligase [Methanobacterium alcaliphilum]|uniref:5-formyltetrahydrofolate cyclo-ligase n=1 Tax=Methanobacterium alcaliphilum TaxID=392018 RepID=UPI00200ADFA7|nr:5-formyltetrahydrofolate cyclo-ligase [Methanobacterium alcaliphilum]